MTTEQSAVMRRQMLDRYELVAEIASGGMATVYLGRLGSGTGVERLVAIKKLHPHLERQQDFVEMFLDEARIAARIHHPNVVSTLEFGATPSGHFLVMDYVEGPTLAKLLAKAAQSGEPIPRPVGIRIVLDTLAGLQVAHDLTSEEGVPLDVVHRDVSPQNVLVGIDGTARITDFGVARAAERLAVTRTGQLKGKLSYMAPEQAKGEATDRRADVFAMGILLWECIAGRRLFRGKTDSEAETLTKVLYGDIARVSSAAPDVSPALDDIVAHALERPLDARFQSCADFIEAIEQAARAGHLEIGSTRDVARYVEHAYGNELAQRRATIRRTSTPPGDGSENDALTSTDGLRHLSSVSSAALSVDPPSTASSSMPRAVPIPPPPEPPRNQSILLGALGVTLFVAVAAVGTMVWVVTRPPSGQVAPTTPTAAQATQPAAVPTTVTSVATATGAPGSAATGEPSAPASASASASGAATAVKPPAGAGVPPAGNWGATKKNGGLSSNPYLR